MITWCCIGRGISLIIFLFQAGELDKQGWTTSIALGSKRNMNPAIFGNQLGKAILRENNQFLINFKRRCCKYIFSYHVNFTNH